MNTIAHNTLPTETPNPPYDDNVEDIFSTLEPTFVVPEEQTYYQVAMFWLGLGFTVIPGELGKKPVYGFRWKRLSGENPIHATAEMIREWAHLYPKATPLLIPDSGRLVRLTCVDADAPEMSPWIESQFGVTPFTVTTGRVGGGRHHWYLTPHKIHVKGRNRIIGPDGMNWDYTIDSAGKHQKDADWGKTAIDVKSHRNYLVAAGATHQTGRVYSPPFPWNEITLDFLRSLPVFDHEKYERLVKESTDRKQVKESEIWATIAKKFPENRTAHLITTGDLSRGIAGLTKEPFLAWCESSPESVGLQTWYGLATTLAALRGDAGRSEFHRLSALSSKYKLSEADQTFSKALVSSSAYAPTTYATLLASGFPGPVPKGYRSPVGFVRAHENKAEGEPVDIDALISDDLEEMLSDFKAKVDKSKAIQSLAKDWQPLIRKELLKRGWLPSVKPCWFTQLLRNMSNNELAAKSRGCSRLACLECGERLLAIKWAALQTEFEPWDKVYLYVVPRLDYSLWKKQFERAKTSNVALGSYVATLKTQVRHSQEFVAFFDEFEVLVLSTIKLPESRKKGLKEVVPVEIKKGAMFSTLLTNFLATYTITRTADDVDGFGQPVETKARVVGKVSSSQGVCLNPDEILKQTATHAWKRVAEFCESPKVCQTKWGLLGTVAKIKTDDSTGFGVCSTTPIKETNLQAHIDAVLIHRKKTKALDVTATNVSPLSTAEINAIIDSEAFGG